MFRIKNVRNSTIAKNTNLSPIVPTITRNYIKPNNTNLNTIKKNLINYKKPNPILIKNKQLHNQNINFKENKFNQKIIVKQQPTPNLEKQQNITIRNVQLIAEKSKHQIINQLIIDQTKQSIQNIKIHQKEVQVLPIIQEKQQITQQKKQFIKQINQKENEQIQMQRQRQLEEQIQKIKNRKMQRELQKQKKRIKQKERKQIIQKLQEQSNDINISPLSGIIHLNDNVSHFQMDQVIMDFQINKILKTNFHHFQNRQSIQAQKNQLQRINTSYLLIRQQQNHPLKNGLKNFRIQIFNRIGYLIMENQRNGFENPNFRIIQADSRFPLPFPNVQIQKGLKNGYIESLLNKKQCKKQQECAVCLNIIQIGQQCRVLNCKHIFHIECIDSWLNTNANCPSCRYNIKFGNLQQKFN